MKDLVLSDYEGTTISFGEEGWFNATEAAAHFGKEPNEWLRLEETQAYIRDLCQIYQEKSITSKSGLNPDLEVSVFTQKNFVRTRRGNHGGTWLHLDLAVIFARWCSPRFAIWCDIAIRDVLRNQHPKQEWWRARHEAASSFRVMSATLKFAREQIGKETQHYHYSNEALLINEVFTEERKPLDRGMLSKDDLDIIAKLEEQNSVFIGNGLDYYFRKEMLGRICEALTARKKIAD